jgi:phenylalanyl-tRNA synthetase beta chain
MKFPFSLLKMYLDTNAPLAEIAAKLTAIGLEVDGIEDKSVELKPFVVAKILAAEKHPQADKLQVCRVKAAQGELQIVCGAPNARAGIKVALANIGTVIPTNQMEIKAAKVRGVESHGMLCSATELGLGTDGAGIIELPLDAKIGDSIVDVLGLGDPVLDVAITANRGDCMGVSGIARDLAAAGMGKMTLDVPPAPAGNDETYPITIEDREGCPAFLGRIIRGVKNGPSPEWLQKTLLAAGLRPISFLVDCTNFASLGYARPAHVYDLKKLKGPIVVRRARAGEQIVALNDKTYTLSERDCVIADDSGAIGIGGVMGGLSTSVDENTTDILLELALFNQERIAKTGRALQIDSDARTRFERGVDTNGLHDADAGLSCFILQQGGSAGKPHLVGTVPTAQQRVPFDPAFTSALGGLDVAEARQKEILTALGFTLDGNDMIVPSWRHDISGKADLAEEVLRIVGYDHIHAVSLPKQAGVGKPALSATQVRDSVLKRVAAARGLHETVSWGFCSEAQAANWGGQSDALKLLNPISADLSVMRPRIMPHLVEAARLNHARGIKDVALFELGAIFENTTPEGQKITLSGLRTGNRSGLHWAETRAVDVYDVKADAIALLDAAGINTVQLTTIAVKEAPWFHPGRAGALYLGPKNCFAAFGEIHPALLKKSSVDMPVFAFSVFLSALPAPKATKRKALAVSDYQSVTRDFAFVVDEKMPAADLVAAINKADRQLLREVAIFDVYQGKGVEPGKKSIALSVTLQADDRTLTDVEIEKVCAAIVESVAKAGGVLRT